MSNEIGQNASGRILPDAAAVMRTAIDETGGREVFFAGELDGKAMLKSVRVLARGQEGAVPAFFEGLQTREVVIHNHPGGDISPSDADMELSQVYGHNGHGVYIVDNDVERIYVVVEPFLEKDKHRLDADSLSKVFRPDGALARNIQGYEVRPQQNTMLGHAAWAFNDNGIAVVEAPTGVGKTIAYLLPAVKWAVQNRERVVIATKTINLQEQIMFKDIPVLKKCLSDKFEAVLVKGRSNYLCLRKLQQALSESTLFDDEDDEASLRSLTEWARKTADGSRSDLPFMPKRELWTQVCSEADSCLGNACPSAKKCFFMLARRKVAGADLIVANHHIVFSDLSVKKEKGDFNALGVLPEYKRIIFDEAHNIEDSATAYFGAEATFNGAMALLGRFIRRDRLHERGLVPYIKLKIMKDALTLSKLEAEKIFELIDEKLTPSLVATKEALTAAFSALRSLAAEKCGKLGSDIKWRLTEDELSDSELREIHGVYVMSAVQEIRGCVQHCNALYGKIKDIKPDPKQLEQPLLTEKVQLRAYRDRLQRLANVLSEVTGEELEKNTVRWIEIDARKPKIVRLARCPLDVGEPLAEWVYANLNTVFMTSATLAVQGKFDYLFSRIGLDRVKEREIQSAVLDSPFCFEKQALLCLPSDTAAPNTDDFLDEGVDMVRQILSITRGHAFVLCTSFYSLNYVYDRLQVELKELGILPLRHGSATRTQLLEQFRNDKASVLFATDSFWEGVDVAGEALQCVILMRLPFRVPTEPVLQARSEAIEAAGGNSFMGYTVPQAVIKFRQGFGRLIRRKSDHGAIVVLDNRIVTKRYGKMFLNSLPGVGKATGSRQDVYSELKKFFEERK